MLDDPNDPKVKRLQAILDKVIANAKEKTKDIGDKVVKAIPIQKPKAVKSSGCSRCKRSN